MKVIQVNSTLNSGSTGRIAYQLHQCLDQNDIANRIAFGYGDRSDPVGFSLYSKLGTHLHSFLSRRLCMQGLCSVWQTKRLIRFLKRENPDIIHLHNIHGHYLNYVILFRFLKKWNKPIVWTLHDCWSFTGKCAHYFGAGCDKWKTGCYECPNLKTYPDSTFDGSRRNYRLKKKYFSQVKNLTVVCNSQWLKSQVEQSFLQKHRIQLIYNGVDTQVFRPSSVDPRELKRKYGIPQDKFIILGVSGVWKKDKGFDTFLQLADHIADSSLIVLVGVTPAQKENLPKNVIGITKTENANELAEIYSLADVLLNPSREETFGMVAAESMACGTPVIVSNTTACPEIVKRGTGHIVDANDLQDILHAIDAIRDTDSRQYKEKCVDNIKNSFTLELMCSQYYELYQQVGE